MQWKPCFSRWLCACVSLLPAAAPATQWTTELGLQTDVTHSDNIRREADADARSSTVLRLAPSARMERKGARVQSRASYVLDAAYFSGLDSNDQYNHSLDSGINAELIDNRLFLDASINYARRQTDPTRIGGSLVNDASSADVLSVEVAPRWKGRIGRRYAYQFDASYGYLDYQDGDFETSRTLTAGARIDNAPSAQRLGWSLAYRNSRTEEGSLSNLEYRSLTLEGHYQIGPRLRGLLTAGREFQSSDVISEVEDESDYWSLGFNWAPSRLDRLELQMGERLFGRTGRLSWQRSGRNLETRLSYREDLTNPSLESIAAARAGSDSTGAPLVAAPDAGNFVEKELRLGLVYRRAPVNLSFDLFTTHVDFIETDATDRIDGASTDLSLQTSRITTWRLGLARQERDFEVAGRTEKQSDLSLSWTRTLARDASIVGSLSYVDNESSVEVGSFTETRVKLAFTKRF